MALVVVERAVDGGGDGRAMRERHEAVAFCFQTYRVRRLKTMRSADKRHWICFYEAPDAEAVRITQRAADLPVSHIWTALPLMDDAPDMQPGYSLAVAQRALPAADITVEHVRYLLTDPKGCNQRLRLRQVGAYLALDCSRMICAFHAPDLEAVRVSSRESGVPYERIWSGDAFHAVPDSAP